MVQIDADMTQIQFFFFFLLQCDQDQFFSGRAHIRSPKSDMYLI